MSNKRIYALTNEQAKWLGYYAKVGGYPSLDAVLTPLDRDAAVGRMARSLAESLYGGDFWDDYEDDEITITVTREGHRSDARAAFAALLGGEQS